MRGNLSESVLAAACSLGMVNCLPRLHGRLQGGLRGLRYVTHDFRTNQTSADHQGTSTKSIFFWPVFANGDALFK
eukprot:jgi/Botrbrau1/18514/Bobra.0072s0089.1